MPNPVPLSRSRGKSGPISDNAFLTKISDLAKFLWKISQISCLAMELRRCLLPVGYNRRIAAYLLLN
jgi:hypothetical protein